MPTPRRAGHMAVNGIRLWRAEYGEGAVLILLHGGLANSDYWGAEVPVLSRSHRVITVDSRGHGRSTRNEQPFGYDLMAADVVALMDRLDIAEAGLVGWSDGAIIGLDLAMHHPDRISAVFSFAANADPSGVREDLGQNATFNRFIARAGEEYRRFSPTPGDYDAFVAAITKMWATQPNWTASDLRSIRVRTVIADGDHDEAIKLPHTEMLAREIPGASLLIVPDASHFAMLQAPALFNAAVLDCFGGGASARR
jgi:pimeloyl-ACP methyl ester carboxylesterase